MVALSQKRKAICVFFFSHFERPWKWTNKLLNVIVLVIYSHMMQLFKLAYCNSSSIKHWFVLWNMKQMFFLFQVSAEPAPSTAAWCGDWGSATQTCTNTDAARRAHRTMTPPSGSQQRYITSNDELICWTKREATLLFSELLSAKNKDPRLGFECCLCEERLDKCGQNNSTSCNHCPLTTAQM